jgi:uncharacterized protein (DUF2236 family)
VRRLNGIHATVRGGVADPAARAATGASSYRALDPTLLLWVQATLIVTSVRAYDAWVGPLQASDREAFWQEARAVGVRMGIPLAASPLTWPALLAWFDEQIGAGGPIAVTDTARALAPDILRPPVRLLPPAAVELLVLPGLSLLPARIRDDFGIAWSTRRELLATSLGRAVRAWVRVTPPALRSMPQARQADRRARA